MTTPTLIDQLRVILKEALPGWSAQQLLMPEGRTQMPLPEDLIPASVLIALFPYKNEWHFPLIKRSLDGFTHSGQIALPGGRREAAETVIETALREAEEEIGLPAGEVEILGLISPLPIPVSQHLVQPVIGVLDISPELSPDPREVEHIFSISLNAFKQMEIQIEIRHFQGHNWQIPYFEIQGYKVWGATAMILSEFREILLKIAD